MIRKLSLILALCLLLTLFAACGKADAPAQTIAAPTETTAAPTEPPLTGPEALNGKKIIFIGNSYTFWGQAVIHKDQDVLTQEPRSFDHGYFYQLCKTNGIETAVTNWTFGGHDLTDMFGNQCGCEVECKDQYHYYFLKDADFDYVAIQLYKEAEYKGDLPAHLQTTMDFFREVNPNVKFLLLVPQQAHEKNYRWVKDLNQLEGQNIIICDWGGMVNDIATGEVQVPGATLSYDRNTFVVAKDNHHQTILAGYITSLMVYCAITGESAVGKEYAFCNDSSLDPKFDLEAFRTKNYPNGEPTNFVEVFQSPEDMKGIQELVDQYLAKYNK